MKAVELRDLDLETLRAKVLELEDEVFRMRVRKSMGQLEAAQKLKTLRRDLARVKTVLREKESA